MHAVGTHAGRVCAAIGAFAVVGCNPAAAQPGLPPETVKPVAVDDCAPIPYRGGPHLTGLESIGGDGAWELELEHDPRGPHHPGDPVVGERYVVFDLRRRLGVAEVSECGDANCYDCNTNWRCTVRWVSRVAPSPGDATLVYGVGPTHRTWERLRVIDLDPEPPAKPCPKDLICVETPVRLLGWKTVFMVDLDGDGEADLAFRMRSNCGPTGQLAAAELRVRDGRGWAVVERNVGKSPYVFEHPRDVLGDETFPPKY